MDTLAPIVIFLLIILFGALTLVPLFDGSSGTEERR